LRQLLNKANSELITCVGEEHWNTLRQQCAQHPADLEHVADSVSGSLRQQGRQLSKEDVRFFLVYDETLTTEFTTSATWLTIFKMPPNSPERSFLVRLHNFVISGGNGI
jgi:hypothetical protein